MSTSEDRGRAFAREASRIVEPTEVAQRACLRMRFIRQQRRLSYVEMGRLLGLSGEAYYRYESGKVPLRVGVLWAIAQALDVPLGVLVAPTPEEDAL